ncbi:uncharacterized protein C2orf72 homolog [Megalops cyprinoides]|uniref:uncharacterized protein C2orf72 homolog n=1 Tax=Megalops cyprinoides TaxID=118141 RepID=UPI0018647933|nr:uncharacterized protein C2orf72 homolog [Megalops cyprinoides]
MADQSGSGDKDEKSLVEIEFQDILRHIGGKERIYLVSDAFEAENENPVGVLEDFLNNMFSADDSNSVNPTPNNSNGRINFAEINETRCTVENVATCEIDTHLKTTHSDQENYMYPCMGPKDLGLNQFKGQNTEECRRIKGEHHQTRETTQRIKRIIDSPIIIFIFRQQFLNCRGNKICLKEILKDVRERTKPSGVLPALVGLVYSRAEIGETRESTGLLECMMRSVFIKHPPESIWVGHFVPKSAEGILAIKKNACRVLKTSLCTGKSVDRGSPLLHLLQCFPWAYRERQVNQANSTSENRYQEDAEEGIPLKTSLVAGGQPDCRESEQNNHTNSGS